MRDKISSKYSKKCLNPVTPGLVVKQNDCSFIFFR